MSGYLFGELRYDEALLVPCTQCSAAIGMRCVGETHELRRQTTAASATLTDTMLWLAWGDAEEQQTEEMIQRMITRATTTRLHRIDGAHDALSSLKDALLGQQSAYIARRRADAAAGPMEPSVAADVDPVARLQAVQRPMLERIYDQAYAAALTDALAIISARMRAL